MRAKLEHSLDELVQANVISPEVSQSIATYYQTKRVNSPNKLFAIFGVLGGLLIGLGIILLLAHNWDEFSRATKTIWAFSPLLIGQLFAGYTLLKKRSIAWKETAATFLFFAIGASISLVSQVYNIPGSMSSFLLTWIILAAPLIYLLRSQAATLLHLIFMTSYACNVGYFNDSIPLAYIAMLAWTIPHYYRQLKKHPDTNITGIYHWFIPLSILISLGAFVSGEESLGFVMYICLFGLFYNLGKLPFFTKRSLRVNGFLMLGSLGTVTVLMFASFNWMWTDVVTRSFAYQDIVITIILGLSTLAVLWFLFQKKALASFNVFQYVFLIFGAIYTMKTYDTGLPFILTNILVFALGIVAIRKGVKLERFSILNYGLLIITVLIACRFFDTELSFVVRGLLFVAIGVGFFITNYVLLKKQNKTSHE